MSRVVAPGIVSFLRRGRVAAAAAVLATGLAGTPLVAQAAGPQITIGSTTPDQAAGTVTLGKVKIVYPGANGTRIEVDTITLKGMAGSAETLQAAEIGLSGLKSSFGSGHDTTIAIDAATLTNVSAPLPSADKLGAESAAGSLPPLAAWLLAAKAERIAIPSIEVKTKIGPISTQAVYNQILLTGVDTGKILSAEVGGATQTSKGGPPGAPSTVTIGAAKTEEINLVPYAAWLDDALAAAAPAGKTLLYKSFYVTDFTASGGDTTFSIDRLSGTDVKIGPPTIKPSELTAILAKMEADPKFGEKSPAETIRFVRAIFGAFEIGTLEVADLKASAAGKPPVAVGLLRFEAVAGTKIGEIRFGDIAFVDPDSGVDFKLGSFALRGFDLVDIEPLLEKVAQGQDPETLPPEQLPKPRLAGFAIADLDVTVPGKGKLAVNGFTVDTPDWVGFSPVTIKARVEGFEMPVSAIDEPETREQFGALGLTTIGLDSALDLAWKEADETLDVGPIALDLAHVGNVEVSANAGGVPRSVIESPQTAEQAIATLDFRGFGLKLEDGGAFAKILDLVAQQQGVTRAQLAQQTAQQVQGAMIMLLGMEDEAKTLSTALGTFISDPRSLSITIGTREPIPAIAFVKVSEGDQDALSVIKKSVTLEATANQ